MTSIISIPDRIVRSSGWSTEELELFGHAAKLLSYEGYSVETDYGLTDEGEPWLVLCDGDSGDIFGHFARLDEGYIACVPFDESAMTGWELGDLLRRFLRRHGIGWSTVTRPIIGNADRLAVFGLAILQQCA